MLFTEEEIFLIYVYINPGLNIFLGNNFEVLY